MATDRYNAVEAQTVRLYFRNYSSNILTNVSPLSVEIRSRGSSTVLASPIIVNESTGVYYVDWAIPSSDVDSLKYSPTFPGTGDYQDVWKSGVTTLLSQDFFVYPENFPNNLAKITEPIRLNHTLETNRFDEGAKDYLTWRVAEINNSLVAGESLFPEGQLQLFLGDQLIRNYDYSPLIHKEDSDQYKYFLDTTSLKKGIYKVQCRFFVPQTTVHTKANLSTVKSLANGYYPNTDTILGLTIDGTNRTIPFYRTSTNATVQGQVSSLTFNKIGNDVLKFNVDGTERQIRLVNTGSNRTLTSIIQELNAVSPPSNKTGTIPTIFSGHIIPLSFPCVTSNLALTGSIPNIIGKTLVFEVDAVPYTVQFTGALGTTIANIVSEINGAWQVTNPGTVICQNVSNVITFAQNNSGLATSNLEQIEIVSGTALPLLGFVEGQSDIDTDAYPHSIWPLVASENPVGCLQIQNPNTGGTLTLYSAAEGSSANNYLGLSSQKTIADAVAAEGAKIEGLAAAFPISVTDSSSGSVTSANTIPNSWTYPNTLGGKTLEFKVDGGTTQTVTFADNTNPTAITSIFAFGTYTIVGTTQDVLKISRTAPVLQSVTVTYTPGEITARSIITQTNTQLAAAGIANILMDLYNGRLRLRATVPGVTFELPATGSTARSELGFDTNIISAEPVYQNDQISLSGSTVRSHVTGQTSYIKPFSQSDVVTQINAQTLGCIASISSNRLVIKSDTTGVSSSIEIKGGTSLTDLYLNGYINTVLSGTVATNNKFTITTGAIPSVVQTVTLNAGIKSLTQIITEINSQVVGVLASQGGTTNNQLVLTTTSTGTGVTIAVADVTSGTVVSLFGAAATSDTGASAILGTINGSTYTPSRTASGGNARLILSDDIIITPTIVDLSSCTTVAQVVTAINALFPGRASNPSANLLLLQSPTYSANSFITIGGLNDGSDANALLGFSQNGLQAIGTNGQPYTLQQIAARINAAFGGFEVAVINGNFLEFQSITEGAGAEIIITDTTSADILNIWGLSKGTYVGESRTQNSQTIVSPKLSLFLGE